jgi:CHAT domain-containing protein
MTSTAARVATAAALWAAAVAAAAGPLAASGQEAAALTDNAIERRIYRGDEHRYAIALDAGEHARVVVEQRGVDIVAQLRDGDGRVIAEVEDELGPLGEETVGIVADAAARYEVVIRAAPGTAGPGGYAIRVDARRRATDADRALYEARTLRASAERLYQQGRFDAARSLLERALTLTEASRGADAVETAAVAAQLGGVYRRVPDDARSEAMFERALQVMDASLGTDHPTTAVVRSRLAVLYRFMGQRAKAETLLHEAMDAIEGSIGSDNRWFVGCLTTLASLRHDGGDFDREETILRRAIAIMERIGDTETTLYATLFNNLGEVYRERGEFDRAGDLYQRALGIGERILGTDAFPLATSLQNLGVIARERKDYARAEAYYARVLSIRERAVGSDHPDVAQVLNNIAIIDRLKGDIQKSLQTHLRALGIWERASGPYQDATLTSVGNIARTYAAAGDLRNAVAYQRRADAILEKQLTLNLATGSERQKLLFVTGAAPRTDRTLSLHLRDAPGDADAAALAALVLLQRKGRVQDAMADAFAAARHHIVDVRDQDRLDRLQSVTAELSRLALSTGAPAPAAERRKMIAALETEKERLEAELSDHSAVFRAQVQAVTLEAVQSAIPDDAALLEFAIFHPFDPRAERNAEAYGPPHYAAYVIRRQAPPRGVDLGAATAIDASIDALRTALRDPRRGDVKDRARDLDAHVLQPLRAWFGDAARLLVSPDGALNLVPFEALVDEQGRYVVERHATTYLTSGRDLLRMRVDRAGSGGPVIFADPLFGERTGVSARPTARGSAGSVDLSGAYFAPLAATADEARALKALFPEFAVLTGARARKSALQLVEAPRMLHIASHGFFLADARPNAGNPLLRSGIALAGANLPADAEPNGILTALEASALDLWGTRLVTLSACDTGLGVVRNGEGVYGLRRAFVLAGTETLVMSLWPVSDAVARETMVAYYTGLRAGLGRGDALRQSQLTMLKRPSRQHPFYWASFIQSGEWASLNGAR